MKQIGTLKINPSANVSDIEQMIDNGLEQAFDVSVRSNQNGTYTIIREDA